VRWNWLIIGLIGWLMIKKEGPTFVGPQVEVETLGVSEG